MPELAEKLGDKPLANKSVVAENVINIVKIRALGNNYGDGFCAVAFLEHKDIVYRCKGKGGGCGGYNYNDNRADEENHKTARAF